MDRRTFLAARKDTGSPDVFEALISTSAVDRDGDQLLPEGGQFDHYRRNPVVLASHDHTQPIGRCVAIQAEASGVRVRWTPAKGDPTAERWANLVRQGVVSAYSVGFLPMEWQPLPNGGRKFTLWELLEFSVVAIPSNPEALARLTRGVNMSRYTAQRLSASFDRHLDAALRPLAADGVLDLVEPDLPLTEAGRAQLEADQRLRRWNRVQQHRERVRSACESQARHTTGVAGQPFLPQRR